MRRLLFWKIFISFWLTQIVFISYLGIHAHKMANLPNGPLWMQNAARTLPLLGEMVVAQYENSGRKTIDAELARHSESGRFNYWLLDLTGRNLGAGTLPRGVSKDVLPPPQVQEVSVNTHTDFTVLSTRVIGKQGSYIFAGTFHPVSGFRTESFLRLVWISAILSCIMCLLLAHYLTRPVVNLRKAAHRLAQGDLDARAGEELGNRSDEIADLVRDFDQMADRIRELIRSQKRLLSDVSHDLRSPLARLRVALALARRNEDSSQQTSHARIEHEIGRLDELIGRILTTARLESGTIHPQLADVSLTEIVRKVVGDARFESVRTGREILLDDAVIGDIRVRGDEELLHSAIDNVVRNAIYYSKGNEPVEVSVRMDEGNAFLTVRDHGPGVPESAIPNLFRPFYRVDDSRVSSTGGTGLGLAIAQRAILVHGGSIEARNVYPTGLLIEIKLRAHAQPVVETEPSLQEVT